MPSYDFRILLETVEGNKSSYYSSSFVNTSVDNFRLTSTQVYHRITGSVSASYQNETIFSGSDINTSFTFKDNNLLSASLSGSEDTGSIVFTALDTEYDRLLRYKFIGEKVTNVLGLPSDQWIYVDQVRLPVDDEANVFQGNANLGNVVVTDTLTFAGGSDINSDVPILIDTASDRYIKFVDERGISEVALRMGYDADTDIYEITGSPDFKFKIGGVDTLDGNITSSTFLFQENVDGGDTTIRIFNTNTDNGTDKGAGIEFKHATDAVPAMKPAGKIIAGKDSGYASAGGDAVQDSNLQFFTALNGTDTERLRIDSNGLAIFTGDISASGDLIVEGSIQATQITSSIVSSSIIFSSGSNIFGDADDDTHTFNGHITASGNISASGNVIGTTGTFNTRVTTSDIRSSGDLVTVNDNLYVNGNITASGNISASGYISSSGVTISEQGDLRLIGGANDIIFGQPGDTTSQNYGIKTDGNLFLDIDKDNDNTGNFFQFRSNAAGTNIMRIKDTGEVGIGTTSPSNALHIVTGSGTNLTPALKLQKEVDGDGSATGILLGAVNAGQSKGGIFFENKGISSGRGSLHFASNEASDTSEATIADARMTIIDGGNVGIGTTTPTATLHISSSNDPNLILEDPNGSNVLRFRRTDQNKNIDLSMEGNDLRIISTDNDGSQNVLIGVNAGGTPRDNRLGLGVPNPTERLSVFGNVSISGSGMGHITASGNISASGELLAEQIYVGSNIFHTGDTNTNITFGTDTITFKAGNEAFITITEDGSQDNIVIGDGGDIDFHVKAGGDNTLFVEGSSQRVGIGTNAPTQELDLRGELFISSSTNSIAPILIHNSSGSISLKLTTDANQHNDFFLYKQSGEKVKLRTYWPSKIDNDYYETGGGLILGSERAASTSFYGLYISSGSNSGSLAVADTDFVVSASKVGIGTKRPDNALHISYDSSAGEGSVQNNTGAVGLQIENTNASGVAAIHLRSSDADGYIIYDDSGANAGDFYFKTDGGDSLAVLTLLDGGNVGIGTESPTKKLQVEGDISASGNLNIQGSITATSITSSFVTSSVVLTEGSTQFGDASGDTHTFIGNITASGNISASGEIAGLSLDINGTSNFADDITIAEGKKIKVTPGSDATGSILSLAADQEVLLSSQNDSATGDPQQFVLKHNLGDTELINRRGDLILSASTDRVGVGTNAPTYALHVSGSELRLQKAGNDAIITSRTDGAGAYFIADSQNANYAGFQINHSGGGAWFLGGYNSADFNIVDGPRNTGFKQFVVKNSNGNVEIRTGSLHLIGQDGGHITASGNYSGSANSTFRIGGKLIAGSKSFVIDRPEGGKLEYGVLEGQQNDVFFRGELKGDNVIYLPQEWEWLVDDNTITVQLTSIGKHQELFVKEIKDNKIFIDINGMCKSKKDIHCYHIIHGTRKDVELIRNYQ